MFGYERGAFTGAVASKAGRFEMANGGTLFLDEVGNLPMDLQAKLLRALQEKTTQRLGSTRSVTWSARIVAATNVNLREAVAQGRFREDLLYRFAGVELAIPPLRDRPEDLPHLADHFLRRHPSPHGPRSLSPEALAVLRGWPWPGNVRELEHVIARAAALAVGPVIRPDDLPEDLRAGRLPAAIPGIAGPGGRDALVTLEDVKRRYARHVLEACGGRKAEAARLLDIDPKTLNALLGG
jgi:transcriptional regulator with GAF, ATPase, and Fis domain